MSTNNFSFKNICIVVHDNHDENEEINFDEDLAYWQDTLSEEIPGFNRSVGRTWTKDEAFIIGSVDFHKTNGEHYATIYITYKSGYYAAACLDYLTEYSDEYEEKRIKSLEAKIEAKTRRIIKRLSSFGQRVIKIGQFSNGEAVYRKA